MSSISGPREGDEIISGAGSAPGDIEITGAERLGDIEIESTEEEILCTPFDRIENWAKGLGITEEQIQSVDYDFLKGDDGKSVRLTTWEYDHKGETGKEEYWAVPMDLKIKYTEGGVEKEATLRVHIPSYLHADATHPGKMEEDQRIAFQLGGLFSRAAKVHYTKEQFAKEKFSEQEKTMAKAAKLANEVCLPNIKRAYVTFRDTLEGLKPLPSYQWTSVQCGQKGKIEDYDLLNTINKTRTVGESIISLSKIERRRELEGRSFQVDGEAPIANRMHNIAELVKFNKRNVPDEIDKSFRKQLSDKGISEHEYASLLEAETEKIERDAQELVEELESRVPKNLISIPGRKNPISIPGRGTAERTQNLKTLLDSKTELDDEVNEKNAAIKSAGDKVKIPDLEKKTLDEIKEACVDVADDKKQEIIKLVEERDLAQGDAKVRERQIHEVKYCFAKLRELETRIIQIGEKVAYMEEENLLSDPELDATGQEIRSTTREIFHNEIKRWKGIYNHASEDPDAFRDLSRAAEAA